MKNNKKIKIIISAVLIIIWMIAVFAFSSQDGEKSSNTSNGTVEKIVSIVLNKTKTSENKKQEIIYTINPLVRKIAHYLEYAIGGCLIINFVILLNVQKNKAIFRSIFFGVFYAITDELHQLFVPGRSAQVVDVFIDSCGIVTGVLVFFIIYELKHKKRQRIRGNFNE